MMHKKSEYLRFIGFKMTEIWTDEGITYHYYTYKIGDGLRIKACFASNKEIEHPDENSKLVTVEMEMRQGFYMNLNSTQTLELINVIRKLRNKQIIVIN